MSDDNTPSTLLTELSALLDRYKDLRGIEARWKGGSCTGVSKTFEQLAREEKIFVINSVEITNHADVPMEISTSRLKEFFPRAKEIYAGVVKSLRDK